MLKTTTAMSSALASQIAKLSFKSTYHGKLRDKTRQQGTSKFP